MKKHKILSFFLFFFAALSFSRAFPQGPVLLKDINTLSVPNPSSNPTGYNHRYVTPWDNYKFARIGNVLIFSATDGKKGIELWRCSPVQGKAELVKDIRPGFPGSYPSFFTNFGNKVLFRANDGVHGEEPWITDGTAAGTFMLKDCRPGALGGGSYYPVIMGGKVYWTSYNGKNYDIWASDGTTKGTRLVFSGLEAAWSHPLPFGTKIIFRGKGTSSGYEPWVTDGTAAGTKILLDAIPGVSSGYLYYPVVLGPECLFFVKSASYRFALYATDGTPKGTRKVAEGFSSYWKNPIPSGGKIVFEARGASGGYEPWVTDGTSAGTKILKDIRPGGYSGHFADPVAFKGKVYFRAYVPSASVNAIWETDGTTAGTKIMSVKSVEFDHPTVAGRYIYFVGADGRLTHGGELWKTDGTDAGTMEVKDIRPGSLSSHPQFFTDIGGGRFAFSANDGIHGQELWVSDGTPSGTRLSVDIYGGPIKTKSSYPFNFIDLCGITYFTADDGVHGRELWKTDGTPLGTKLVKDVLSGRGSGTDLSNSIMRFGRGRGSEKAVALGNTLFFQGNSKEKGREIWKTDGTASGTVMVKDIYPGPGSGYFYYGCVLGDKVYFFARDASGYALWKTDGTSAGTVKVKGGFNSYWNNPFPFHGKIYFNGQTSAHGSEPWVTDGTQAGTKILKDIKPGYASGYFFEPVGMGGKVYFRAMKEVGYGFQIYSSDGTPSGTKAIIDLGMNSAPYLRVMGNKLFFLGYDASGGEPWISDGTQAGTRLLKDIRPGPRGCDYRVPCVVGNTLFFRANDGIHGEELWKTDGTASGTRLVKDIAPGSSSSSPNYTAAAGTRHLVFQAYVQAHGRELWITDGTAAGTRMVQDIYPGSNSSEPLQMTLSGGRVIFRAGDGTHGVELWVWFPGATAKAFGFGTDDRYALAATDPALGKSSRITLSGMKWGQAAVLLFADPTCAPETFGNGRLYFDTSVIYTAGFLSAGPGRSISFPVPGSTALVGGKVAAQAFVFPTPNPPYFLDLTNAVLLTFGR